jgi:hypothetical protein
MWVHDGRVGGGFAGRTLEVSVRQELVTGPVLLAAARDQDLVLADAGPRLGATLDPEDTPRVMSQRPLRSRDDLRMVDALARCTQDPFSLSDVRLAVPEAAR